MRWSTIQVLAFFLLALADAHAASAAPPIHALLITGGRPPATGYEKETAYAKWRISSAHHWFFST